MKVVLKKAVLKLGVPGEIVDVKPGYAFNFLIPQGLALFADEQNLKDFEAKKAEFLAEHNKNKSVAEKVKSLIEDQYLLMERAVNDAGNFYSVINASEVADCLNEQFKQDDFTFTKGQIAISKKIRNYGIYQALITLYNGVIAKVNLSIEANLENAKKASQPNLEEPKSANKNNEVK